MSKLYEKIDSLKEFTTLKECIVNEDPMLTSISLYYGTDLSREIVLVEAVKGFNKFENIGYLIANMEPFIEDEEYPEFFTSINEVKLITLHFSNGTEKEYGINWCSPFNRIDDDMYIMLFETNNGEYYLENSKS